MLTVEDLLGEAEQLGIEVAETKLPYPYFGYYDDDRRAIIVDCELRSWQLKCALCHGLVHARHRDLGCMAIAGIRAERRTRRETSRCLIDPVEYASAEILYDGDVFSIACELEVTLQVIRDYQQFVLANRQAVWKMSIRQTFGAERIGELMP